MSAARAWRRLFKFSHESNFDVRGVRQRQRAKEENGGWRVVLVVVRGGDGKDANTDEKPALLKVNGSNGSINAGLIGASC